MSRGPDPVMVALTDQITAVLRDWYPKELATVTVCEKLGVRRYDDTGLKVYLALRRLRNRGQVEKVSYGNGNAFWRLTRDPADDELVQLLAEFEQEAGPS